MWTWNSLVATQTESAAGAPGYGRGWYGLLIALFLCLSSLKAQADTYPAIREYKAWVGSGVAVGYESPVQPDFQSAGKIAWDAWQIPSPDITKIDWFADSNCQGKAEPAFISQSAWVEVWVTYGRAGVNSCSWSYNYVFINLVCPYGGTIVVDQCYNAPPCQAPLTRDLKTGACIQSCQKPDVTDPATGQCVKCTIDPIPELPQDDKDFACTQSLDKGAGKDVDGVCPPINAKLTAWNGEMQCFAKKLAALHPPIPYSGPSATIRTKAYQQHLLEVFKNSEKVANLKSEVQKQACAARIAEVEAHMKFHQIKYRPSSKGGAAPHVQGNAFDVPEDVVNALMERVTMVRVKASIAKNHPGCISCMHIPMVTGDVQDYINSAAINPPACKLDWGGRLFVNPSTNKADTVHFQLQNP
jgi:hypothetical protein